MNKLIIECDDVIETVKIIWSPLKNIAEYMIKNFFEKNYWYMYKKSLKHNMNMHNKKRSKSKWRK